MPIFKCEQCGKEFDRPRKQPYCSPECFQLILTKRKNEYLTIYEWIIRDVNFPKWIQKASRESLQWQFEKQVKKEVMKGSYKAFLTDNITSIQEFYEYVLKTVRVRRA